MEQYKIQQSMKQLSVISFNRSGFECFICREILYEKGKLNCCDHDFCKDCIVKWVKRINTCPFCRKIIKSILVMVSKKKLKEILRSEGKVGLKKFFKMEAIDGYFFVK